MLRGKLAKPPGKMIKKSRTQSSAAFSFLVPWQSVTTTVFHGFTSRNSNRFSRCNNRWGAHRFGAGDRARSKRRGLRRIRAKCNDLDISKSWLRSGIDSPRSAHRLAWKFHYISGRKIASKSHGVAVIQFGSVALATDERDFGRDECHFLKLGGFALPMHKTARQKTA